MEVNHIVCGDSLNVMKKIELQEVDVIYLDPPFYTQETQKLKSKDNKEYSFEDKWENLDDYLVFMQKRLKECHRILKNTGSIFLHCDRNAAHYLKIVMDKIFGIENFQSEIIWYYKRWSNSKKGLLNNHQVIFFYSKTSEFKFNTKYTEYSPTTNIDQVLQDRARDKNGKSIYKLDENGNSVLGNQKKGVPLSDVWEIPYLNPKAKERVGYPTQKPIILMEKIIELVSDEGDIILDPFCGSGTTLVAAKILNRKFYGIDNSREAVDLSNERLNNIIKTESNLLKKGKEAYKNLQQFQLDILKQMNAIPVQRNSGIDGFLSEYVDERPVSVKIQKDNETLLEAYEKLKNSSMKKNCSYMVLVRTHADCVDTIKCEKMVSNLILLDSFNFAINEYIEEVNNRLNLIASRVKIM